MIEERSLGHTLSTVAVWTITAILALLCILPFIIVIAKSLSSSEAIHANLVTFWPVGFNLDSYNYLMKDKLFYTSFGISLARVLVGVTINLAVIVLTAYPLSQDHLYIPGRTVFKVVMIFGMLFSAGLIPVYLSYKNLGLLNKFAVFVLPGALNIFFAILITNFFRGIPKELTESAVLDGANHIDVLFRIFLPLSLPSLATVALFSVVGHWNSWFDGILFMKHVEQWPLQSYLYNMVTQRQLTSRVESLSVHGDLSLLKDATPEALAAAMVVLGSIPIMMVYPFMQRYFVQGLTLGAVKG